MDLEDIDNIVNRFTMEQYRDNLHAIKNSIHASSIDIEVWITEFVNFLIEKTKPPKNRLEDILKETLAYIRATSSEKEIPRLLEGYKREDLKNEWKKYCPTNSTEVIYALLRDVFVEYIKEFTNDSYSLTPILTMGNKLNHSNEINQLIINQILADIELPKLNNLDELATLFGAMKVSLGEYRKFRSTAQRQDLIMYDLLNQKAYRSARAKLMTKDIKGKALHAAEFYIDLNGLKNFNDIFGSHKYGDILLECVNHSIKETIDELTQLPGYKSCIEEFVLGRDGGDEIGLFFIMNDVSYLPPFADEFYQRFSKRVYDLLIEKFLRGDNGSKIKDNAGKPINLEDIRNAIGAGKNEFYLFGMHYTETSLEDNIAISSQDIEELLSEYGPTLLPATKEELHKNGISKTEQPFLYAAVQEMRIRRPESTFLVLSKLLSKQDKYQELINFFKDPDTIHTIKGKDYYFNSEEFIEERTSLNSLGLSSPYVITEYLSKLKTDSETRQSTAIGGPSSDRSSYTIEEQKMYWISRIISKTGLQGSIR